MKPSALLKIAFLLAIPSLFFAATLQPVKVPEKVRKFEFTYDFTVKDLSPSDHIVRIWIPLASSDKYQSIVVKKVSGSFPTRVTQNVEYGDRMLYAEIRSPKKPTADFSVIYEVTRREYSKGNYQSLMRYNVDSVHAPANVERFLEPDRLVPVTGKLRELAGQITQGKQGAVEKAHALYDYVFKTMRYDKSGTGWGHGDALWACDSKHGNCTDFHSLFISMMRAEKIPARFVIGFPLPEDSHQGIIPGYHCWAEFYLPGRGWVPVDISEAWLDPSKHDYFFGTVNADRVRLSEGRDLKLVPRQDGPPINYFVYPYVEVNGKSYDNLDEKFAFRDTSIRVMAFGGPVGLPH